jgi:hypothetical protein
VSSVAAELRDGTLALAGPAEFCVDLNIQLYRSASNRRPIAERIWACASRNAVAAACAPAAS